MKFSDRLGITTPPTKIQVGEMSSDLRNSLWNLLVAAFDRRWFSLVRKLFVEFFKLPVDQAPHDDISAQTWFRKRFMLAEWHEVYNLIEHISGNARTTRVGAYEVYSFRNDLNHLLEQELSGYRMVKGILVPISDEHEVQAIDEAVAVASSHGLDGARTHLLKALNFLGKKPQPDYLNSIKESISAVESVCKTLTGERSGGLDKALEKLEQQISLHPAMKKAFGNLYGYASNEDGIRHAILESAEVGFGEAKFMLVACAAFVNYVATKAQAVDALSN